MIRLKFTKNKQQTVADVLRAVPGAQFVPEAAWNDFTSLGAGSASFPLIKVCTVVQAVDAVKELRRAFPEIKIRVIGGGTNLVGADRILPDTVFLKLMPLEDFAEIRPGRNGLFLAGAALSLKNVLEVVAAYGFGGASGLFGIPGTIGGAAVMNAGANGQTVSQFIDFIEILNLDDGSMRRIRHRGIRWGYRWTSIGENELVTRVCFRFAPVDPRQESVLFRREILRRMRAPAGRSAGSIFRNPSPDLPAGRILEKCGVKKLNSGRFSVSADHANWIINRTDRTELPGSEAAFLETLHSMAKMVYDSSGICLTPEVKFIDTETVKKWGKDMSPVKVLVLKGGTSSERDVSLQSAANVAQSLRNAGFEVREYDIRSLEITGDMRWADVVYPVLHGGFGEDGTLQKMLEDAGIRAVGSSAAGMKIVMDKIASKKVMDANGINNAKYAVLSSVSDQIPAGMELPLIVKPNSEGSTFGLTLVEDEKDWKIALETALKYDKTVLVEEYIEGVEATVGILLGKALPLVEIRYPGKLYDYDAKYTHAQGETLYLCPPEGISPEAQNEAKELALRFAKAVDSETLLRVDVIIRNSDNKVFVLEGNSMPGCTASSLLPKAAMASGVSIMELYTGLVFDALNRKK